jgi:hypothetical protein
MTCSCITGHLQVIHSIYMHNTREDILNKKLYKKTRDLSYIKHNTHNIYEFMICLVGTDGLCNAVYLLLQRNTENKGLSDRNSRFFRRLCCFHLQGTRWRTVFLNVKEHTKSNVTVLIRNNAQYLGRQQQPVWNTILICTPTLFFQLLKYLLWRNTLNFRVPIIQSEILLAT